MPMPRTEDLDRRVTTRGARLGRRDTARRISAESLEPRCLLAAFDLFGTGVAADGSLLPIGAPDPHFSLVSTPVAGPVTLGVVPLDPVNNYVPDGPTSEWIGPLSGGQVVQAAGQYVYRTSFDLTGYDPATAVIRGQFSSDNSALAFLNGVDTGLRSDAAEFAGIQPLAISSGFTPGVNYLDFVVHNNEGPTGLRLDMALTATPIGPAPVLTSAIQGATSTAVQGTLAGRPDTTYDVAFYAATTTDPTAPASDRIALGDAAVTTDGSGAATYSAILPTAVPLGDLVAARAAAGGVVGAFGSAVVPTPTADLAVSFAPAGPVGAGQVLTLAVTVTNLGPAPAAGVSLVDALPAGTTLVSDSTSLGTATAAGGSVTVLIPSLDPGASATLTLGITSRILLTSVDTAGASSSLPDPDPGNNSAAATVSFLLPGTTPSPGSPAPGTPFPVTPAPVTPFPLTPTSPAPTPVDLSGPTIVSVVRVGRNARATRIEVTFDRALRGLGGQPGELPARDRRPRPEIQHGRRPSGRPPVGVILRRQADRHVDPREGHQPLDQLRAGR